MGLYYFRAGCRGDDSQRLLSLDEVVDAWVSGARFTFLAMIILVLSWAMAEISPITHADFLIASLGDRLPLGVLPTMVLCSCVTAFATGSSWCDGHLIAPRSHCPGQSWVRATVLIQNTSIFFMHRFRVCWRVLFGAIIAHRSLIPQ